MARSKGDTTKKQKDKLVRKESSTRDGKADRGVKSEPKAKPNKDGKRASGQDDGKSKAKGGKPPGARTSKGQVAATEKHTKLHAEQVVEQTDWNEKMEFVRNQKDWCDMHQEKPPLAMAIEQGARLLSIDSEVQPSTESLVAIVGDRGAGKSTVAMSLLQLVILDVKKKDAGTRVRTLVRSRYDSKQQEDIACSWEYPAPNSESLSSVKEVREKYLETSKHLQESESFDNDNVCEITISTNKPVVDLGVIDHAGFDSNAKEVGESFKDTKQHYFDRSDHQNSCVLLCHKINKPPSEGTFSTHYEQYADLSNGQFYVAFTQCDRIAQDKTKANIVQQMKEERKHLDPSDESKVRCKPIDIIQFFIDEMLAIKPEGEKLPALPRHTRFFFVAGYHGDISQLMEMRDDDRMKKFLKEEDDSEIAFMNALEDVNGWRAVDLNLVQESNEERAKRFKMIGMKALSVALREKSFQGYRNAAENLMTEQKELLRESLQRKHRLQPGNVGTAGAKNIKFVVDQFVEMYLTMSTDGLDSPGGDGDVVQARVQTEAAELFSTMREAGLAGWTLEEEHVLLKKLNCCGEFPPKEEVYMVEDWKKKKGILIADILGKPNRDYLLNNLMRRFQAELAMLCCLLKTPEVDIEDLKQEAKATAAVQVSNLSEALMQRIKNVYSRVWRGSSTRGKAEGGGLMFAATRCALACLLHAQNILTLLRGVDVDEVKSVLSGHTGSDLVDMARHFSRVENENLCKQEDFDPPSRFDRRSGLGEVLDDAYRKFSSPSRSKRANEPYYDVCKIIIAHFFDKPLEQLRSQLDYLVRKIELCSTGYAPMSTHFGPLFMFQDQLYLDSYKKKNSTDHYPSRYIQSSDKAQLPRGSEDQHRPRGSEDQHRQRAEDERQTYSDKPALFQNLAQDAGDGMMSINASHPLDVEDKARLLCSLIRANKLPDIIGTFEADSIGDDDKDWLNYVSKRFLSCAQKRTLDDVLEACAALQHDYLSAAQKMRHLEQANERLESLLLSYKYPFLRKDRPANMAYLSESEVIQFLECHKEEIKQICHAAKNQYGANRFSRVDETRIKVNDWERKIHQSPLFQAVIAQGLQDAEEAGKQIDNLHKEWKENNRAALVARLLGLVAPDRYQKLEGSHTTQSNQEEIEQRLKLMAACKSYVSFLESHGDELLIQNVPRGTKPRWTDEKERAYFVKESTPAGKEDWPSDSDEATSGDSEDESDESDESSEQDETAGSDGPDEGEEDEDDPEEEEVKSASGSSSS